MRRITLTLAILLAGGAHATAPAYGAWQTSADETVSCMAIGCQEGDYERYPEYAPQPVDEADGGHWHSAPRILIPGGTARWQPDGHDAVSELLRPFVEPPAAPVIRIEPIALPPAR